MVQSTSTSASGVEKASVSALGKEVTCRDCGGAITPVWLHVVAYFAQHLQRQNMQTKDKRKVKPTYYGEALTRNEMLKRIEEAEREKREQKAKKGGRRKKVQSAVEDTTS